MSWTSDSKRGPRLRTGDVSELLDSQAATSLDIMFAPASTETPPFGTIIDVKLLHVHNKLCTRGDSTDADSYCSFGPLLIGVFFNMILFGLLIAQMMTYFQSQRRDALWIRALVFYVLFVECSNTALDIAYMYQPLILEYGSIPGKLPTVFIAQPLSVMLIAAPLQLFFLWRVRALTGNRILPVIFALFAALSLGGGVWTMVDLAGAHRWDDVHRAYNAATVWLASSTGTDVCIAVCLAWALRSKKTGFASTDTVVDRIVRMTVQTGVITAVVHIVKSLILNPTQGKTVNFMWNIPLSKLYSNSMMSTLNARAGLMATLVTPVLGSTDQGLRSPGVFGAARRFNGGDDTKGDTMVGSNSYDLGEAEYGIRVNKIVERV
ncbi:hypothetical protein C8R46DRAFT_1211290 [Mycena filopes]|nr:hypothetical protein C8R46DRAFT_1211290 [Mycena filopes]